MRSRPGLSLGFREIEFFAREDGSNRMLVDQLVSLSPQDDTEVVETVDHSFDPLAIDEFNDDMVSFPPDPIQKLILNIDLILHHGHLPSSPLEKIAHPGRSLLDQRNRRTSRLPGRP